MSPCLSELVRTPLIFESEEEERRWKKARRKLKRATKRVHKKVEKKIDTAERKGPREDETGEQFAHRLLDKQETLRRKSFDRKRKKLSRLQSKETKRFDQYVVADRERRARERPTQALTTVARNVVAAAQRPSELPSTSSRRLKVSS